MPDNRTAAATDTLLILMPDGQTAAAAADLLMPSGIVCRICPDLTALCAGIDQDDPGAVLVADEALLNSDLKALTQMLGRQPAWSDLPFVVLTQTDIEARRSLAETHLPEALGNVVFLEHPLNRLNLLAAVRSAFRARQRQRHMRAYLAEQHVAEAALRESEARFRHMADSVPALIWMTDAAGHIVFVNLHHSQMFGRSVADIVRDGWTAIVLPKAQKRFRAEFMAAFHSRSAFAAEIQVRDKDARIRWLRCDGVPRLDDSGRFLGYTGCGLDITDTRLATQDLERRVTERTGELSIALERLHAEVKERLQAETALRHSQKMDAIGQLTGGIAHDFNNMLQGIMGCLDLIDRRLMQGRLQEIESYVKGARRSLDNAAVLTKRLLAFARRQTLQPASLDPDSLVRGIEDLIRRTVGPGIQVMALPRDGGWRVRCDANQLENALLNLCINARDAMADGGTLTIETTDRTFGAADLRGEANAQPGEYVRITVADNGLGMTPEVAARAFEPFFTTKPFGQGTGLGLSQLYGFVRQSGGFVQLASAPQAGTTVRIHLPKYVGTEVNAAEPAQAAWARTSDQGGRLAANGMTVLVVEDETDVRHLITRALHDLDYHVVEAADGNAGLRVVQSKVPIDLLVTDVGLPGLNGKQLADTARERRPELPVLLITGYAGKTLEDLGVSESMDVMAKPFTLDALTARVQSILRPLAGVRP